MAQLWLIIWILVCHCHHLWFSEINFAGKTLSRTSVSVSVSNLVRICFHMAELSPNNWFQNSRFRHLGFLHMQILMANVTLGPWLSAYLSNSEQICAIMAELWQKCNFNIGAAAILDFGGYEFWGKICPGTLFSVYVSNLVQVRSKMVEFLPFNWFQNGGRRHLGFCTMRILTVNLSAGPNFQPLSQIRCKCVQ